MKPSFILIIGTLLLCFSFGSALGGETKKPCPDHDLKYGKNFSAEEYWQWFVMGNLSEWVRGDQYLCAVYTDVEDYVYSSNILISLKKLENRKEKEAGLIQGIKYFVATYDTYFTVLTKEELDSSEILKNFIPSFELMTGLKFETDKEWFEWLNSNEDRLVLSEDGKYLVVKK